MSGEKGLMKLRSPIAIVAGHVDAGKTSLLDYLRSSSIANNEAGGITQQIGATFLSMDNLKKQTQEIKGKFAIESKIPGILAIDTPGHEAFYKLRQRGASMCDIAIVVIDIIEGVLPQTKEVLRMMKENKIPFVVALTKIDKIYGWTSEDNKPLRKVLKKQSKSTMTHFNAYLEDIKYQLSCEEIEADFYFTNKKPEKIISMVPINSLKGEGIADLLALMVYLTSTWMEKKLMVKDKFKAIVMESVKDKKMGWVSDLILVNGKLQIGDEIVIPKLSGSIVTKVKNIFIGDKPVSSCDGACSCRIIAKDLDNCLAGGRVYLSLNNSEELIEKSNEEREELLSSFVTKDEGIIVIADTVGAMDAFNFLLSKEDIPVKHFLIEKPSEKLIERYGEILKKGENYHQVILYFGSCQDKDVIKKSKEIKITFLEDEVIYRLIEKYKDFEKTSKGNMNQYLLENNKAVLPAELRILKEFIFMKGGASNFLFGVKIKSGKIYVGMPVAVVNKEKRILGKILGIQKDNKDVTEAKLGDEVCIRVENPNHLWYERHFNEKDIIYSEQSRDSIDNLKKYFKDELKKEDWMLVIKQKKVFGIE